MNKAFIAAAITAVALSLSSCSKGEGAARVKLSQAQGELIVEIENHTGQSISLPGRGGLGVPPSMNAIVLTLTEEGEPLVPCALVDPQLGFLRIPDGGEASKRYKISYLKKVYCPRVSEFEVYASLFLSGKEFRSETLKVYD